MNCRGHWPGIGYWGCPCNTGCWNGTNCGGCPNGGGPTGAKIWPPWDIIAPLWLPQAVWLLNCSPISDLPKYVTSSLSLRIVALVTLLAYSVSDGSLPLLLFLIPRNFSLAGHSLWLEFFPSCPQLRHFRPDVHAEIVPSGA